MTLWPASRPGRGVFAKRQLTWFKRMPYIHWYEKDQYEDEAALARAVIRDIDAHWRA